MQRRPTNRFWPLLFALLPFVLTACPSTTGPAGAPNIVSFTATPANITAPGQPVTLEWEIAGAVTSLELDPGGSVTGSNTTVTPAATTTYTLTATNGSGNDTATVEVTLGGGGGGGQPGEDTAAPEGTFGVGLSQNGPFQSDENGNIEGPSDPRIVRVQPGDTFYALVSYSDPGGITGVNIRLVNSEPAGLQGDLVQGQEVSGFTLVGEVNGCVLDGTQTTVNCIYEIAVGDIPNIDQLEGSGDEFAYVFRAIVLDTEGNGAASISNRGYVIVGDDGGTPNPPIDPDPPTDPDPPVNRAPTADFTFEQQDGTLAVVFSGADSSDPDDDPLSYEWDFGDGTEASTRDFRKTYREADDYTVSLTVTDPDGESDTETQTVTVEPVDDGGGEPPTPDTYTLTVTAPDNGTVTGDGINCGDDGNNCSEEFEEDEEVTLTAEPTDGYVFSDWGGACSSADDATCTVTMNADKTVTVAFEEEEETTEYTLTVTAPSNGEVTSDPEGIDCGDDCIADYDSGEQVELTAEAADGYEFSSWAGAACEEEDDSTCVITMNDDETVSANFAEEEDDNDGGNNGTPITPTHTLSVGKEGMGVGRIISNPSGINCTDECPSDTGSYGENAVVTLSVEAAMGSTFEGWSGSDCTGTGPCQVTMTNDHTVIATFGEAQTPPGEGEGGDLRADFEYEVSGLDVTFTSATEGSNGEVLSYSWDFGDGALGNGPYIEHAYDEANTYTVYLTVRTGDGAASRVGKSVTVPD